MSADEPAAPDLSGVRWALSPLGEVMTAVQQVGAPAASPAQAAFQHELARALHAPALRLVRSLTHERGCIADFVTPRPRAAASMSDELAALARVSPDRMRADLRRVHGAVPAAFDDDSPATVTAALVRAVDTLWRTCFAPRWNRFEATLSADIAQRARASSLEGVGAVVSRIDKRVRLDGNTLVVQRRDASRRQSIDERGLVLVPSLFADAVQTPGDDTLPPMIVYPAFGRGTVWLDDASSSAQASALAELVGAGRARVLTALRAPGSTGTVATMIGVTPSAANQHLQVLLRNGLVRRVRVGRSVQYSLSPLGQALVDGADSTAANSVAG